MGFMAFSVLDTFFGIIPAFKILQSFIRQTILRNVSQGYFNLNPVANDNLGGLISRLLCQRNSLET